METDQKDHSYTDIRETYPEIISEEIILCL